MTQGLNVSVSPLRALQSSCLPALCFHLRQMPSHVWNFSQVSQVRQEWTGSRLVSLPDTDINVLEENWVFVF